MVNQVNVAREREIPLSSSCSGYNGFVVSCKPQERSQSYFVCQHVVMAVKEKRIGNSFTECQGCISEGKCIAVKMMIAERKEGRCLFYANNRAVELLESKDNPVEQHTASERQINKDSEGFQRGWHMLDSQKSKTSKRATRPAPKAKKATSSVGSIDADIFGAVIDDLSE